MPVILTALLVTSCASQKRAWYLQDAQPFTPEQIAENGQIRIKPLDRLTIVVNSKDPELAVPFNSATSYNSLTGTNISGAANSQALQMRTVDENGMLEMPVIGKIECKGKTRSELAQAIAEKIIDGGYINDPTVNVQFADMKISVIGEVARPGFYDVTRDKVSIFDALAMAGDMTVYGVRMMHDAGMDQRNTLIAATSICLGVGVTQVDGFFNELPSFIGDIFAGNMVAGVFVVGLILDLCLPRDPSHYEGM